MSRVPGYGEGPLHLLGHLALWGLAVYAGVRLLETSPWLTAIAFASGIVLHDAVFYPLYAVADRGVIRWRRARRRVTGSGVPWINYLRVPVVLSGVLLLLWFPIVLRLADERPEFTGLSQDPFLYRWLGVTAVLFAGSAAAYAFRARRASRTGQAG